MNIRHNAFLQICLMIAALLIPVWAAGQQTDPGVPVQMVVTAEPKHGNELPPITAQDVIVKQGKDQRPVLEWSPATGNAAALELAILIDDSSGFSFGSQMDDIRSFITEQPPTTLIAVGYMQNGTVAMTTQGFTQDHAAAAKSLRLPQGYLGVEASPYFSLSDLIKRWPANPSVPRREVLMITDGIDPYNGPSYPDPYVDTAVQDAQCAGVVVYTLYTPGEGHFGHAYYEIYWGQNFLAQLSDETGGESFYFLGGQAPVAFEPYLNQLAAHLSHQYILKFMAEDEKKAGPTSVKLSSEMHGIDFVHQDKVCVPASPGH